MLSGFAESAVGGSEMTGVGAGDGALSEELEVEASQLLWHVETCVLQLQNWTE